MPILEVKNICKSFGSTEVLKGISFSLEQGQVVSTQARMALSGDSPSSVVS